jgi:hypothetical protein
MYVITTLRIRSLKSRRSGRPRRRAARVGFERLEGRALPSATTLLWSSGVSLPAASGGAAAALVSGSIIELGGKTTGSSTAVNQLSPSAASWTSLARTDTGWVGPGLVVTPNGLLVYGAAAPAGRTHSARLCSTSKTALKTRLMPRP